MSDDKKSVEAPKPPPPAGPPPPKNPGLVTCTIDGRETIAKPGTNLIEAAKQVGVEIPYYCYHPRLTIAANCRMCMVESSGAPPGKLVPACQTPVAEGVAIKTNTPKVSDQQRSVMEFLLLNHPVDCSICDQAGECKLQDYYMKYDSKPSRLEGSKILRTKRKALSDLIVIDQERCIVCTRCVRFMDEVAGEPQLGVFGRGSHEVVDIAPHYGKLSSNYSGNIVDLCPVGALLNRDFRFKARAWFLSTAPTVCTGCSRGCSIYADFMGQDVFRLRPRENEAINKSWMCDEGRLTYKALNKERVLNSTVGKGDARKNVSFSDAVSTVAAAIKPFVGRCAVAISPNASNEDLMATFSLVRDAFGQKHVYVSGRAPGAADKMLMTADKNANRKGLEFIAKAFGVEVRSFDALMTALTQKQVDALVAFGHDVPVNVAEFADQLGSLEYFAATATNHSPMLVHADAVLAQASMVEEEGTLTQVDSIIQRVRRAFPPRGEAQPLWKWAVALSNALGTTVKAASTREVFMTHAPTISEFSAFEWDKNAPALQHRPGISTMAAASDGRPPGWREQGIPNVRGLTIPPGT